jgi:hypothetical protein
MSHGVNPSKPYVRLATAEDCLELSGTMRKEDVEEIFHSSGRAPYEALLGGLYAGDCYVVTWQDKVVAMFGCAGVSGKFGTPWMLASDDLVKIRKSFLREAKEYLQRMEDKYVYLTNWAWAKNKVHIQWLRWMGVRLDDPAPQGDSGELFIRFHKGTYV